MVLKNKIDTWQIPIGDTTTIISPQGYFLLWVDDEEVQGKFHTNFKLSAANGEILGLCEPDSVTVIDSVTFPPLSDNQSYGKCNGNEWVVFNNPSPLSINHCVSSGIYPLKDQWLYFYPTITIGDITIDFPNYSGGMINLYLFSMDGKLVLNKQYNNETLTIDLSNLRRNIYFLNITLEKYSHIEKIIVIQ